MAIGILFVVSAPSGAGKSTLIEKVKPLFPDMILYAGRNAVIEYEPDNDELGYSRNNVRAAVDELVRAYL